MEIEKFTKKEVVKVLKEALRLLKKYKDKVDLAESFQNVLLDSNGNVIDFNFDGTYEEKVEQLESILKQIDERALEITTNPKVLNNGWKMGSLVVTLPEELHGCSRDEKIEFFQHMNTFLRDRYGEKNIMPAPIHFDETTPHATFLIVPEAISRKTGQRTLSTASLFDQKKGKGDFYTLHPDCDKFMQKIYGIEGMMKNGKTVGVTSDEKKNIHALEQGQLEREREQLTKEQEQLKSDKEALKIEQERLKESEADFEIKIKAAAKNHKERKKNIDDKESQLDTREAALDTREAQLNTFAAAVAEYKRNKPYMRDTIKLRAFLQSDAFPPLKPTVEDFIEMYMQNREELFDLQDKYNDYGFDLDDKTRKEIQAKLKACEVAAAEWEAAEDLSQDESAAPNP